MPFPVATQLLKPVAPQGNEVLDAGGGVQYLQPFFSLPFEAFEGFQRATFGEPSRSFVSVALNHERR